MDRSLKDQDKERILGNINIISKDKCKSVCPDTINSPGWQIRDYWYESSEWCSEDFGITQI